jgi:hypothetical protein
MTRTVNRDHPPEPPPQPAEAPAPPAAPQPTQTYIAAPVDLPPQARTLTGAPPPSDAPLTITGAPAPVIAVPEAPPMPSSWGPPPPGGPPLRPGAVWNWAAGAVVGLAVLAATLGIPLFAESVKFDRLGSANTEDWLLWACGGLGVICAVSLATRMATLVSVLSGICAVLGIAAFAVANDEWDVSSPATWGVVAYMVGFAILGACSAFGLRRR